MSSFLEQLAGCLRFYSRLPLPAPAEAAPRPFDASHIAAVPIAGAVIGLVPAVVLGGASLVFTPLIAATLAVAALVLVTGALHEDGLADCADALGASTSARKLDIMRDSRIGSFGAIALAFDLILRVAAVSVMAGPSPWSAALVLVAAAAVSRTVGLLPAVLLPPARADGAGAALGRPKLPPLLAGFAIAAVFAIAPMLAGAGFGRCFVGMVAAVAAALAVSAAARRQIGGFTGDVLGAAQQIAEIAVYLAFASTWTT